MSKKILLLILNIFFCSLLFSQFHFLGKDFQVLIDSAQVASQNKEYSLAASLYEKAFNQRKVLVPFSSYYFDAFKSHLMAGNDKKAFYYLDKYSDLEWIDLKEIKQSDFFNLIKKDNRWNVIEKKIYAIRGEYEPLRSLLLDIRTKDQTLRNLISCAEEKFSQDTLKLEYFYSLLYKQDSINLTNIKSLIAINGWPSNSKVGIEASSTIWLVIQHASIEDKKTYLPLIQKAVNKGELPPHKLAYIEDSILLSERKKQKYGSQYISIEGANVLYPVEDRKNLNQIRKEVGLGTIEEYLSFFDGVIWDKHKDDYIIKYIKDKNN